MERALDLTLNPSDRAYVDMLLKPQALRVYESSVDGMTTVVMHDPSDRFISAGTRLTREQLTHLVDELSLYLHGETAGDAYNRGYANGFDAGEEAGWDNGYEVGYGRGRDEVDW